MTISCVVIHRKIKIKEDIYAQTDTFRELKTGTSEPSVCV